MLAKCSNPSCSALFLYLGQGKLFRLESDPATARGDSAPVEYYWLCGGCSSAMTLHLGRDNAVTTAPIADTLRSAPGGEARISEERKGGLVLRSVSNFWLERVSDRGKPRATRKNHAA